MMPAFEVNTTIFKGPLDILLDMIERKKLHVSDVSLSQVSDDFLQYVKKSLQLPKEESANFLVVASTLMLIKSVSLLPGFNLTIEEKEEVHDLERRLDILRKIKEGAEYVGKIFGRQLLFGREERSIQVIFSPSADLNIGNLKNNLENVIASLPKKRDMPNVFVQKVISLEEVISNLLERVKNSLKLNFNQFLKNKNDRTEIIVSFLGMLELIRQGIIQAKQDSHFTDIHLESNDLNTPHYR